MSKFVNINLLNDDSSEFKSYYVNADLIQYVISTMKEYTIYIVGKGEPIRAKNNGKLDSYL